MCTYMRFRIFRMYLVGIPLWEPHIRWWLCGEGNWRRELRESSFASVGFKASFLSHELGFLLASYEYGGHFSFMGLMFSDIELQFFRLSAV